MPSKRTLTAKRVTEEVTLTEVHEDTAPMAAYAPGWTGVLPDEAHPEQRRQQVERCLDLLWLEATDPDDDPRALVGAAATVLRAGPGASPKELLLGGRRA